MHSHEADIYVSFMPHRTIRRSAFTNSGRTSGHAVWRTDLTDLIVLVLGTGGILFMAAYAALCDRI